MIAVDIIAVLAICAIAILITICGHTMTRYARLKDAIKEHSRSNLRYRDDYPDVNDVRLYRIAGLDMSRRS